MQQFQLSSLSGLPITISSINFLWYVFKKGQVYYMSFAFVSDVCIYSINVKAYTVFVLFYSRNQ